MSDPDKVKFSDQTGLSFQNYYQLSADEHLLFYLVVHHITHCHHVRAILFVLELGSLFRSNSCNCQFRTDIFLLFFCEEGTPLILKMRAQYIPFLQKGP